MELLPLTYDGLYYVLGLTLALIVDANVTALPLPVILFLGPAGVVLAFNAGYHLVETRVGPGAADERRQAMVESSMAWGFVAFGVVLAVSAAGADSITQFEALRMGVMVFVAIFTLSQLRHRYATA